MNENEFTDMLQWFQYDRLLHHQMEIGKSYFKLAYQLVSFPPYENQKMKAIERLLESRDYALRSMDYFKKLSES